MALLPCLGWSQVEFPLVSIEGKNLALNKAILKIRKDYDVSIAYDNRVLKNYKVNASGKLTPLDVLLKNWLEPIGFTFEVFEQTIVVVRLEDQAYKRKPTRFNIELFGQVVDLKTLEPLPFATISVENTNLATSSNSEGYFSFEALPNDTVALKVSYVGYDLKTVHLSPETSFEDYRIFLIQSRAALPVARVTTFRDGKVIGSVRPSLQTLDPELAYRLPGVGEPDIIRALQLLPGVNGSLENSAALHVRGGASDENLVTYDGFTIYYLDHFFGIFSAFNSNSIRNIRLHKGVLDANYGGRASSVLEITGKTGSRIQPEVKANINLLSASLHVETPLAGDKATLMVSGRRSYTDVIYSSLYQTLFNSLYSNSVSGGNAVNTFGTDNQPDFRFYDITAKVSIHTEDRDKLSFSVYNGQDNLTTGYEEATTDDRFRIQYNDRSQWGNTGGSGQWSRQWDKDHFTQMSLGVSRFESELFGFDKRENLFIGSVDTLFFDRNTSVRDLTFKINHKWRLRSHELIMGAEQVNLAVNNGNLSSGGSNIQSSGDANILSVYLGDNWRVGKGWSISPGLRETHYTVQRRVYHEPRLRITKDYGDFLSFQLAAGRHYQFIRNVRRQDLFLNTSDEWRLSGKGQVPVLESDQLTFGWTLKNEMWEWSSEAFYKRRRGVVEDALRLVTVQTDSQNQLLVGDGDTYGFEVLVSKTRGVHSGWVSYSFLKTNNAFDELEENEIPSWFDRTHEGKFVYMYRPGRFHANAVFVYSSGLPFTPASGIYDVPLVNGDVIQLLSYGQVNSARLPNYHRLDLSAYYDFQLGNANASVGASLYNTYNRENVRNRYYYLVGSIEDEIQVEPRDQRFLQVIPAIHFKVEW